jgi:hypothetical protein
MDVTNERPKATVGKLQIEDHSVMNARRIVVSGVSLQSRIWSGRQIADTREAGFDIMSGSLDTPFLYFNCLAKKGQASLFVFTRPGK